MTNGNGGSYNVHLGIPLSIFTIIAVVIGLTFVLQRGWEVPDDPTQTASQEAAWQAMRNAEADPLSFGDDSALIELVVFSDYQCAFCAHWSRNTLPDLIDYVESGQLRIVWRDANLSGKASERGAKAAYAAALQDEFFEYHEALSAKGHGASDEDLSEQALTKLADDLGLNVQRFSADMSSPEAQLVINQNRAEAKKYGVVRTPSFIFNGEFVSGVQSRETFMENLESAFPEQDD